MFAIYQSLDAQYDELMYIEPDRFQITDVGGADWALRKHRQASQRIAQRKAEVEAEIKRLRECLEKNNAEDQYTVSFMEGLLRPYAERQLEGQRKKTLHLPGADLSFAAQSPEIQRDDEALLAWIKASNLGYIRKKEEVDWSALKSELIVDSETGAAYFMGEEVPSVRFRQRPDRFTVKPKEE